MFFRSTYGKIIQRSNWGELHISVRIVASAVQANLARGCGDRGGARGRVGAASGGPRGSGFRQAALLTAPGRAARAGLKSAQPPRPQAPGHAFAAVAQVTGDRPAPEPAALTLGLPSSPLTSR